MQFARTPVDEPRRLATLHRLGLLDTAPEARFDTLAAASAQLTGCAAAGISLIDGRRQWLKAAHGLPHHSLAREHSLCAQAMLGNGLSQWLAHDTPLVQHLPPVAGQAVRLYAGVPLQVGGLPMGTLFVLDVQPRQLSEAQGQALLQLAQVVSELMARRSEPGDEERSRLLDFARASGDWMWELDAELRYTWVSGAFEAITGLPPQSVYGQRIADSPLLDAKGEPLGPGHSFHALLRQRQHITRIITDKSTRHGLRQISRSAVPVFDAQGQFAGYRGTARDITEPIARERHTHAQADLLRKLSAQVPGVIAQFQLLPDRSVRFLYASDACRELFGAEPPQNGDGGDRDVICRLLHPDDEPGFVQSLVDASDALRPWHREVRIVRDGRVRWIDMRAVPEPHPEQGVLWHAFSNDVTDRKEAELALRRSEQRWTMAAQAAGIGIAQVDLATGLITLDAIACQHHGLPYPTTNYSLSAWHQAIVPPDRAGAEAAMQRVLSTRSAVETRYRMARADGSTSTLEIFAQCIVDGEGRISGVVGACKDVTQQVAHEQLRRDKESAERANLAKSEFLSRVSHELRTPLNGILGFAQLMALDRNHPLPAEHAARIDSVLRAGRHLLDLINDMLHLARIEQQDFSLQPCAVDLVDTVTACVAMVQPLAKDTGVVLVHSGPIALWGHADVRAVEQVLLNLLSNAIKYNRPKGCVFVEMGTQHGAAWIAVRDEGPGLSHEQQAHLFEPFNRLGAEQRRVEGTGLGLVIARTLAQAMHGELSVESQEGHGATFTLKLPLGTPDAAAQAPAFPSLAHPEPLARSQPKRVLYIEDEPLNQLLLQEIFKDHAHWQLTIASDGAQGLAALATALPDLVLIDMNLPDTTGLSLIQRLRADPRTATLQCIALSADALQTQIDAALAAGFDAYWTKPIHVSQVIDGLNQALA